MAVIYSYITVANAISAIASRLYDPTFQQWPQSELLTILTESLRTWNALSGFWRGEFATNLNNVTWWTDLRSATGTIIPYTVKQNDLIQMIEAHLLEPSNTGGTWTGSAQYSFSDIQTALLRRQNEILGETGCTITQSFVNAPLTPRTVLPSTVLDIRRVAWLPLPNVGFIIKPLRQSDMFATRAFDPRYTTASTNPPGKWMQNAEPPISFDVDAVPPVNGAWDLLSVNSGPDWVTGTNSLLDIPDDWTWVLKYGALMDLFSRESSANDPFRAEYCRQRYEEGKTLMRMMPTVLALRLNNQPVSVGTIKGADAYNPLWQAQNGPTYPFSSPSFPFAPGNFPFAPSAVSALPTSFYNIGNLLAVTPIPYLTNSASVTVSVCQNAPLNATYVQVARDDFDTVLDLCQHIAMLKQGGAEFAKTVPLYQRAQRQAALYNSKLREMGFFSMDQLDISTEDERRQARYSPGVTPAAS